MNSFTTCPDIENLVIQLILQPCCRKEVGYRKSLSLGFGQRVPHHRPKARDAFYGEWELGTYNSAWRVIKNGAILCGSHDPVDSIKELDRSLQELEIGCISSFQMFGDLDVRIECANGVTIDFLATANDNDECFHLFCPHGKYLEFNVKRGWVIGSAQKPWEKKPLSPMHSQYNES